jgi:hypothetical protein
MADLFNFIPFLAAISLLINPILYFIFRRWELNIQKLSFWFMLTSAVGWLLLILTFLVRPEIEFNLGYLSDASLLPGPVFILDWISISLGVTIGGLVLFSALSDLFSPQQIAWISGIGGIGILGSLSGSVYTLLFFWALIEVLWVTYSTLYQSRDRGLILPVAFRLLVPILLVYASGVRATNGVDSFSTYGAAAAPFLIGAGALGIGAWIPFRRRLSDDRDGNPEFAARLIPACLSLMVVIRGGELINPSQIIPFLPILVGLFVLVAGIVGHLSRSDGFSRRIWMLGLIGLVLGASIQGSPVASLGWGLVFLIPV